MPEEEQICVRDMFGNWFCERGESAKLTLKNHPTVNNLGNRDTLVAYQLAGHTALSLILAYCTTVVQSALDAVRKLGTNQAKNE